MVFDTVVDAEFHDIKRSVKFYWNPILEILIKIRKWVGGPNMRGQFLMKVRLMTIYNYPNLRNLNHVKKQFLVSFWYETFFAKPCSTTGNT